MVGIGAIKRWSTGFQEEQHVEMTKWYYTYETHRCDSATNMTFTMTSRTVNHYLEPQTWPHATHICSQYKTLFAATSRQLTGSGQEVQNKVMLREHTKSLQITATASTGTQTHSHCPTCYRGAPIQSPDALVLQPYRHLAAHRHTPSDEVSSCCIPAAGGYCGTRTP